MLCSALPIEADAAPVLLAQLSSQFLSMFPTLSLSVFIVTASLKLSIKEIEKQNYRRSGSIIKQNLLAVGCSKARSDACMSEETTLSTVGHPGFASFDSPRATLSETISLCDGVALR